jgi:hypothetical protein
MPKIAIIDVKRRLSGPYGKIIGGWVWGIKIFFLNAEKVKERCASIVPGRTMPDHPLCSDNDA